MPMTHGSQSTLTCEVCGRQVVMATSLARKVATCGADECKRALGTKRAIERRGPVPDLPDRTASSYHSHAREVRACIICDAQFLILPKAPMQTCSKECDSRRRSELQLIYPQTFNCAECGAKAVRTTHVVQTYCSNKCRIIVLNRQKRVKTQGRGIASMSRTGYMRVRVVEGDEVRIIMEHRYVMEQHLGRRLTATERVHHINGIRADNRLENLQLFASQRHHLREAHPDMQALNALRLKRTS